MAQFIVRNLEDDVRDKLREMARNHGQSMEEMVREILRRAVMAKKTPKIGLGTQMAKRFSKIGLKQDIPEFKGRSVEPPSFD